MYLTAKKRKRDEPLCMFCLNRRKNEKKPRQKWRGFVYLQLFGKILYNKIGRRDANGNDGGKVRREVPGSR